jgi:hypothetical protein
LGPRVTVTRARSSRAFSSGGPERVNCVVPPNLHRESPAAASAFEKDCHITLVVDRTKVFGKLLETYAVLPTASGSRMQLIEREHASETRARN